MKELPINATQTISGGCVSCITGEIPEVIDLDFLCLYTIIIQDIRDIRPCSPKFYI